MVNIYLVLCVDIGYRNKSNLRHIPEVPSCLIYLLLLSFFSFTICVLLTWNAATALLHNCYKMTWNTVHTFWCPWIYFGSTFIIPSSIFSAFIMENFQHMQKYGSIINLLLSSFNNYQLMVSLVSYTFSMLSPSTVLF